MKIGIPGVIGLCWKRSDAQLTPLGTKLTTWLFLWVGRRWGLTLVRLHRPKQETLPYDSILEITFKGGV